MNIENVVNYEIRMEDFAMDNRKIVRFRLKLNGNNYGCDIPISNEEFAEESANRLNDKPPFMKRVIEYIFEQLSANIIKSICEESLKYKKPIINNGIGQAVNGYHIPPLTSPPWSPGPPPTVTQYQQQIDNKMYSFNEYAKKIMNGEYKIKELQDDYI